MDKGPRCEVTNLQRIITHLCSYHWLCIFVILFVFFIPQLHCSGLSVEVYSLFYL